MKHGLQLLRHAKSSWQDRSLEDFERPLAPRGRRDAARLATWLAETGRLPQRAVCSPARRARQTVTALERAGLAATAITFDERLYLADRQTLCEVLADCPAQSTFMLVGHNPGFDDLVTYLSADPPPRTATGKLMTTAALAELMMPEDWTALAPGTARKLRIVRPAQIPAF